MPPHSIEKVFRTHETEKEKKGDKDPGDET